MPRAALGELRIENLTGLRPSAWLCVGAGFSREDLKSLLLSQGKGFVSEAMTTLQDVARKIVSAQVVTLGEGPGISADRVLGPLARQEILRMLLSDASISAVAQGFPELKRLRRQSNFYRKLDQAIQAGRLAFAHAEEEQVYLERLAARLGEGATRLVQTEVRILALGYEAWMRESRLWDLPLLYLEATRILREQGWPEGLARPREIFLLSNQVPESRERDFCDALKSLVDWRRIGAPNETGEVLQVNGDPSGNSSPVESSWSWKRWHTWDDAVDGLMDRILADCGESVDFSEHLILISDQVQVRRSLNRALAERGVPQADPRDPTRIRWDEGIKWAMLPLEVVGRDFERTLVISWLRAYLMGAEFQTWVSEINSRGVRQGLKAYSGGNLVRVHSFLTELSEDLGGKKACQELAEAHLGILRRAIGLNADRTWILDFFERVWKDYVADLEKLGREGKRAPLRFWLERFRVRVQETPSPVEPLKADGGIQVFRLQQACLPNLFSSETGRKKIWILGLPPDWLSGESVGDYWFSEREREVLGAEFSVRSGIQVRQERAAAFQAWVRQAGEVAIFDSQYDPDGRERETLTPVLRELLGELPPGLEEPEDQGAHPRWVMSYGAFRPLQPQEVQLSPMPLRMGAEKPELTATTLDRYSRCAFQGLAYHRWKLRDFRDPDTELWPEVRGNILHQAVRHLLASRDGDGNFMLSCSQALDRAWTEKPPKGLLKSARIEAYVRSRMLRVLEVFCAKEREYFSRAQARPVSLDDQRLSLDYPEFRLVGTPDRIDMTDDGLFIMDYKTSSANPNGTEMLELGYRLQLPFYALAAGKQFQKPVAGVQFVELSRQGSRSSGMFFKRHNGKEPGKFSNVRSNSKSLLQIEPDEAWSRLEEQIVLQAKALLEGRFDAKPKKEKECDSCQLGDLCGVRRSIDAGSGSTDGNSEGGQS